MSGASTRTSSTLFTHLQNQRRPPQAQAENGSGGVSAGRAGSVAGGSQSGGSENGGSENGSVAGSVAGGRRVSRRASFFARLRGAGAAPES